MKKGDKGLQVKELQIKLNELGYNSGIPDGIFGIKTEEAVKAFQRDNNLVVDGIAGPKTLTKLYSIKKSKYYKVGNAHIIETSPGNIDIKIIGDTLSNSRVYGINGTFFDTPRPDLPNSCWGIATNNGKPIGGNSMVVSYNKDIKRGTIVYYEDESIEFLRVNNINEFKKKHNWAISGYSIFPYLNFMIEKMPSGINYRTNHTYIGYRGRFIYLIVKPYHMIKEILPLVKMLGLEGCIVLDGGGSSQMSYPLGSLYSSRKINNGVLLKEL